MRGGPARCAPYVVLIVVASAALASCGGDGGKTKLTVFAASSLTETFGELEKAFEKDHHDVDVVGSFGSSSALAEQIAQGAPADVIATADESSIGGVADNDLLVGEPRRFASNTLVIATPPDNPAGVHSVRALHRADFVMCDPSAPCGAAGQRVLDNAGVTAKPRSLEPDVKAVLSKVMLGEVDAGLVYVTDARAAGGDVATVAIPRDLDVVNPYLIGVVKDSEHRDLADQWVALVTSQAGQRVLQAAGFEVT